jgi:hypothetical protein
VTRPIGRCVQLTAIALLLAATGAAVAALPGIVALR